MGLQTTSIAKPSISFTNKIFLKDSLIFVNRVRYGFQKLQLNGSGIDKFGMVYFEKCFCLNLCNHPAFFLFQGLKPSTR